MTAESLDSERKYPGCYAFPDLSPQYEFGVFRLGGTGLSNLLIPWARCLVQARRYGMKRVSPTWFQIGTGPWKRNDRDKRTYHNLFRNASDEITGARRLQLLATRRRVHESQLGGPIPDGAVVSFEGLKDYLLPVLHERELVCTELLKMVRDEHKGALETGFSPDVAIHVRLGDFGLENPTHGNSRLGLNWYIGVLRNLRASLGRLEVAIFSDGRDEELASLLAMDGVRRVGFGSSIADILGLSRAKILITSGSTFSMWASFIGQHPTVWYPERLPHPILEDRRSEVSTLSDLPHDFVVRCEESLRCEENARA